MIPDKFGDGYIGGPLAGFLMAFAEKAPLSRFAEQRRRQRSPHVARNHHCHACGHREKRSVFHQENTPALLVRGDDLSA